MDFLYFLEKIRLPVLDEFMLFITKFGEEEAFLIAALVVFWCISKNIGYYILSIGFIGTITNQFMKLWFRVPRPWEIDPNFSILEQAKQAATGYSFPSGHTQCAVGTFGALCVTTKRQWLRAAALLIAVFVPISRMYIGVHTPADVGAAALIAILLLAFLHPISKPGKEQMFAILLGLMFLLNIAYLLFVELYAFPQDVAPHHLLSGKESAYTFLGAIVGFVFVYLADKKWINFETEAVWWAQILKVVIGLSIVLALKTLTKMPLNALLGEFFGRSVRYFLVVVFAGCLWPLSFSWFGKIGNRNKNMEEQVNE